MGEVSFTVWMAVGYSGLLILMAFALDFFARRTSSSTIARQAVGFTYDKSHDAWVCPEDQLLWPQSFDPDNRVMRYRASPTVCNACPIKETCTTSHRGREVSRPVDEWPGSEAERFHRGIACMVAVLAVLWPLVTMIGHRTALEWGLLAAAAVTVALTSWPLWSHLRRSPASFPEHVKVESLDETVAGHTAAAETLQRRRATYGSTRRENRDLFTAAAPDVSPSDEQPQAGWSRLGKK